MNTNVNTVNTDANNEAAKALADMFAGATIEDYSINGGTITLTLTDGDTIAIRHEIKRTDFSTEFGYIREEREYVSGGISSRAAEAIKNGQAITAAWVEKTKTDYEPTYYGDDAKTTETISLYAMFDGDLRPTLLTSLTTTYGRKAEYPDFHLKRGGVSVTADSARISSSFHRPCDE